MLGKSFLLAVCLAAFGPCLAALTGEYKKSYPPWGETSSATAGAEILWLPLIGPFTRHSCFPSRYMSMRIAVSHLNRRDSTYCPAIATLQNKFEIRYSLSDTSSNGIDAARVIMKLLNNDTIKKMIKVVLGPNGSGASKATSQMLAVFGIPQISWASTNADLSNKNNYPFYFRSVSPDSLVLRVLAGFVVQLGFGRVNLLYFDAPFQSGQAQDYLLAAETVHKQEVGVYKLPNSGQGGAAITAANMMKVRDALNAIRQNGCRIVVGLAINEEAYELWKAADTLGMVHEEGWLWLGTDGVAGGQLAGDIKRVDVFAGTLYIIASSQGPHFKEYSSRWAADMPTTEVPEFTTMPTCRDGELCAGDAEFKGWKLGTHDVSLSCTGYTALAYDAVVTLAVVADKLMTGTNGNSRTLESITTEEFFEGMKSLHADKDVFDCLSGELSYDENQERPLPMSFMNWQPNSLTPFHVADWSGAFGYTWVSGSSIVWPSGSKVDITASNMTPAGLPTGVPPSCSEGSVYNGTTNACMQCFAGSRATFVGKETACVLCDPGSYQSKRGQTTCSPCPGGFASNEFGISDCNEDRFRCKPGFYAAEPGSSTCSACPVGRANLANGSRSCALCLEGSFQNITGSSVCQSCNSILLGSTCSRGAEDASECRCEKGTLQKPTGRGGQACVQCPDGLSCLGGNALPLQAPGFFAKVLDADARDYSVFNCRDAEECPGGPLGSCPHGREGLACNNCMAGFRKGDGGRCESCAGADFLPLVGVFVAFVLVAVVVAAIFRPDAAKQSLTFLTVVMTGGQLVTILQTMGVLSELSVQWTDPVKTILRLTSVLTLDLDLLNMACFLPRDEPISRFISQMLFYPACVIVLFIVWFALRVIKKVDERDIFFDLNGLILLILYISFALRVLLPFQCVDNPGDVTSSMATNPGVVCWTTSTHGALIGLGVVGIIFYPVGIFAWIGFSTLMYPSRLRTSRGLETLKRYRFLFNRFKPDAYYFGSILIFRNLLVALIPVAMIRVASLQLVALCFLLLCMAAVQSRLWPWRTENSNKTDLTMNLCMVLILVAAAPLLEVSAEEKQDVLAIVMLIPLLGVPIACLITVGISLYMHFSTSQKFSAFLCHHKMGAGSLGRCIKLLMQKHDVSNVFLDSDQLEDLDLIFDVVRSRTSNLVILMTPEVQKRMWCAGEMVMAHKNKIPIVVLSCDGCMPLDDSDVERIEDVWTTEQKSTLLRFGVTIPMVKEAYAHIRTLPTIAMPRYESLGKQEEAVLEVIAAMARANKRRVSFIRSIPSVQQDVHESDLTKARILVTGAVSNAEALSTCLNLSMLIQSSTMTGTEVVRNKADMASALSFADYLVVALSRELLRDSAFAELLLLCVEGREEEPIDIVTVNADTGFEFPPLEFFKLLEAEGLNTKGLGSKQGARLAKAYRSLLSVLALPLSPHGSEGLLREQVSEISRRFRNASAFSSSKSRTSNEQAMREASYESETNTEIRELVVPDDPSLVRLSF